jgi:hypothetical protein
MLDFDKGKQYRKRGITHFIPYEPGMQLPSSVSISEADRLNGSPKVGDMIAWNPLEPTDQWLVAEKYFNDNYVPV